MELNPKIYTKVDIDKHIKFIEDFEDNWCPIDHNMREGTPTSYALEMLQQHGLKPIGITYYVGEETFIFKTQEEAKKGWGIMRPHGWWYTLSQWDDIVEKAESLLEKEYISPVCWLDKNYEPKINVNEF